MKKLFSILLVFALLALGFAMAEAGRVIAKGVGQGIDGDVVVQVEADATTIYSVEVLEQNETEGIGSVAVEKLPGAIVAANSIAVDAIAGATVTRSIPRPSRSRPKPPLRRRRLPRPWIATW